MQNKVITFELTDNSVDKDILITPTKQQMFSIAKEESQMFPSSDYNWSGIVPAGFTNDPLWQSENRDQQIATTADSHLNSSWTPTDFVGLSKYDVPYQIDENFADFKLYNPDTGTTVPLYSGTGNLTTLMNGIQKLKIPAHLFDTTLTDPQDIEDNGGDPIKPNYNTYYILVSPKYVETTLSMVSARANYEFALRSYNTTTTGGITVPTNRRRCEYLCPNADFKLLPWGFEGSPYQVGRLLGSVIEIWNSAGTVLKQTKVMNENTFNWSSTFAKFVMSPDHMGYDATSNVIHYGDIIRIYPRETYFDQFMIKVDYVDSTKSVKAALEFMLNDVARDMKTGIYEVYDDNGFTIDSSGNFDGNVILKYQISQYGPYEIRKKLKN